MFRIFPTAAAATRRSMATATGLVDVPLKLHGIDGRYATALFSAASKQKSLEKVDEELKGIKSLLDTDKGVKDFLETPVIDRKAKKQGIEIILGKGKSATTNNFFALLADNGRLNQTSKIISAFQSLMIAHRGEVKVVVTSAKELDAKTLSKVQDVLAKNQLGGKGKKLLVSNKINPQILGGLVIEIGDNTIDLSVSSKITKLNTLLTQAV